MPDITPRYASLFQATLKDTAAGGATMMGGLIAFLRSELQARESAARDFREREVHAESLNHLHRYEPTLRAGFPIALLEQFTRSAASAKAAMPLLADVQFDQLELMDELQVQESVNMARAQQMAMLVAEASLAELNTLICTMLGLQTVRPERNPLRPESYITALRNTVERTPVPASMRLDWLTVMGASLGAQLKELYVTLVSHLKTRDVVAARYAITPASSALGVPGAIGVLSGRKALDSQEQLSPPLPANDHALLTLDRLRKLLAGEFNPGGTPQKGAAFARQFSRQFEMSGSRGWHHSEGTTDFPATVPAALEALTEMRQVDRVVQRLEQRRRVAAPMAVQPGLQAVREEIRRNATGVAQTLSLEVVCLMVDNIARDSRLLEPVQSIVRELEPALMRLALADARFFTDKSHAARLLVQEITHRSLAYKDVQSPGFMVFLEEVRQAMAPLAHVQPEGPELFANALQTLQTIWQQETRQQTQAHTQAIKALEKAEQRNVLAEKIAREIDAHPDSAKVPEVVLAFLCGPWAQVVAQARLSGGARSAEADKYQALISALLWSAHPELAPQNIAKLTKLVPLLLNTLRDGLETIQYPSTKTSAFLEALMGLHQAAFKVAHKEASAAREAEQAPKSLVDGLLHHRPLDEGDPWVAPSEAKDSNFLDVLDVIPVATAQTTAPADSGMEATASVAGGMPLGAWIELHTQGEWVRTQLTWSSPHGTLYLFTTAAGSTQSMTRRTHDKLVQAGQLRVISAQPLVDDALDAVAQQAMKNSVNSRY